MTTIVRSVRVELELGIASYVANARIAGRETDAAFDRVEARVVSADRAVTGLDKSTAGLSKTSASTRTQQASLGREIEKTGRNASTAERSIDKYSGRLGLVLKLGASLLPALAPIGALAVPAVAGLSSQLGFAAAAGGSAVLALRGVGDSLKLIEAAKLDPTVENLKAADDAVHRLAPDAQTLVHHLEDLAGVGRSLQRTAAGGFIPGLDDSITSLEARIPEVRKLIKEVSDAAGDEVRSAGESIASSRWDAFFEYLRTQARPQLNGLADSVGNVAHGFAQLLVATTPLQGDFTSWLRRSTEDFDEWATRLDNSTEFQEFIAYVRENGPQVEATASAIADAILQIVEAAAPLGGPTLQILESVANILGAIADSDVGTPLLTLLSLTSAYSLVAGRVKAVNETAWGGKQVANLRGFASTLNTVVTAQDRAKLSAEQMVAVEQKRSAAIKGGLSTIGKGAALAGLFGIAASGVASKVGLANTATLALAGSMAGPWGAAVGAGVGLLLDWSHRSDGAKQSAADFSATLDQQTGALTANTRALAVKKLEDAGALEAAQKLGLSTSLVTDAALGNEDAQNRLNTALSHYNEIATAVSVGRGSSVTQYNAQGTAIGDVQQAVEDVSKAVGASQDAFNRQTGAMDGATQHTNELRAAYDRTASSADSLTQELSALDDFLNHRGTFRAYEASLDALRKSLKDAPHAFSALGEAGRTNLGNLDQIVSDAARHLETLTDPNQKAAFLDTVLANLRQIGKTSPEAAAAVHQVLPALKEVRDANKGIVIQADNADALKKAAITKLALRDLQLQHPEPVIKADNGAAKHTIDGTKAMLRGLDGTTASPKINVDPGNSFAILGGIRSALAKIISKTINVTVNRVGDALAAGPHIAGGGTVPGPRTPYGDSVHAMLAPGEEIITNRHGEADRFRSDRAAGRIPAYANGGTAAEAIANTYTSRRGATVDGTPGNDPFHLVNEPLHNTADAADHATSSLKKLQARLDKVQASYDKEKSKLDDLTSSRSSLASSIASSAVHDPFGNGLAGLDAQVDADTADIDAMTAALATLVANGLDPKSALYQQLAASMDVTTAQQLAQLSSADLASREVRFQHRSDEANALGGTVAGQEFNESIRDQAKATRELRATLKDLQAEIHQMGDHVRKGAHDGTKDVGDQVFTAVKDGNDERRQRTRAQVRTGSR